MVRSADGYVMGVDESYSSLPWLYLMFLSIWFVSACSWTFYTYKTRHTQWNNLQWTLASVPLIKALQLMLSFLFWYSCFNFQACSLWMSFGVYVTGVLFQTAAFVCFLLISHGYCIMCERLSLTERRSTAALACIFYLTLIGYKACVPYFSVLLLLNYFVTFYIIFHHISQNLLVLREQLSLIENEDIQPMYDAVYKKYTIFKKFQGAMQIVATAETVIYMNMNDSSENYWLRLLLREWAQFCIFVYIGWIFRSHDLAPNFSVMPITKCKGDTLVPPIYSIEMDAATFKDFSSHEWHIGVPTSASHVESSKNDVLVIIQHPRAQRLRNIDTFSHSALSTNSSPCRNVTNTAT
ncbi:uncharacterized protein LOC124842026 isoform X1 [Vigna umbellata]|uniref:uncharacterized protein LOC124842026 isoform X1 n=1 Tax=Vigna umbellata TaxID=87088 RepID=UPI001F5E4A3B|nr:uncharacterized protein LOC124842026 isoform X1 [Vigna umbellata]